MKGKQLKKILKSEKFKKFKKMYNTNPFCIHQYSDKELAQKYINQINVKICKL